MSSRRYYSHRRNPVHRTILCGLFRLGPSGYRHRRESLNPLLRLFGIQPRRSEYTRNQYYAPARRAASNYTPRSEPPRTARRTQRYYSPADQGGQGGQPMTIAERHAAQYRQRQTAAQGQGTPEYRQPAAPRQPSAAGYSQRPQQAGHGRTFHEHRPTHDGKVHSNLPLQAHGNQTFQQR